MQTFLVLAPVFVFLIVMLAVGFVFQKNSQKDRSANFSRDYFIGGRSLGGFVFAMTLVATYSSVSSFVGGPGVAWQRGFGWVYFAMTQVLAVFLVMGVLGKKMAVIGRKIDAVTVIDVIRVRYQSNVLANVGAVLIVVFFCATIVAQFMGGANLFAATVKGLLSDGSQAVESGSLFGAVRTDYVAGMVIFALVVVIFTAVGGFKAVAITDTICAVVMLLGMSVIAYAILTHGGGLSGIMAVINQQPHMLEPTAGGRIPPQLFITQWMLTGVCTLGLPQSLVRNLSYKSSRDLHRAMIYATVVVGAMMLGMHLLGVLSRGIIHELPAGGTTDSITPHLIVNYLPPLLAGMAIIGPLAASISTVSSLLIAAVSSIVKDVYQHSIERRGEAVDQKKVGKFSTIATFLIGMTCALIAVNPPTVIVWVNMFAFGGLQTSFFWVFLLGFFWRKANFTGAIMAMTGGVFAYCYFMAAGIPLYGFHQIIVGIGVGLALFVIGSLAGKPNDEKVLRLFFPEHYPEGVRVEIPERI